MAFPGVKAIFFDFMGTCLDWHTSILPYLPNHHVALPESDISQFALDWRQGFFDEIQARFERGDTQEDIDVTHRRVLDRLLLERGAGWREHERKGAVNAWHSMKCSLVLDSGRYRR